jgi:hypothetical protein
MAMCASFHRNGRAMIPTSVSTPTTEASNVFQNSGRGKNKNTMLNQDLRSSYDGMNRIFWNRVNSRSSISSVSTQSWNPKRRALVVSDITS